MKTTDLPSAGISALDFLADACILVSAGTESRNRSMDKLFDEEPDAESLHVRVREAIDHVRVVGFPICLEHATNCARYRVSAGPLEGAILVTVARVREARVEVRLRKQYGLTSREIQIARMLAAGDSNLEIAQALAISKHTARHHTASVLAKLGQPSRARVAMILAG